MSQNTPHQNWDANSYNMDKRVWFHLQINMRQRWVRKVVALCQGIQKYRSPYCLTVCCSVESALKKVSAKGSVGNWFLVRYTLPWIVWVLRSDNALLRYLHFYSFDVLIVPFPKDFVSPAQKTTTLTWCTTIVWELARVTRNGPLYRQLLWLSVNHRGLKFEIKSSFYWNLEHKGGPAAENCSVSQWSIDIQKRRFPRTFFVVNSNEFLPLHYSVFASLALFAFSFSVSSVSVSGFVPFREGKYSPKHFYGHL